MMEILDAGVIHTYAYNEQSRRVGMYNTRGGMLGLQLVKKLTGCWEGRR